MKNIAFALAMIILSVVMVSPNEHQVTKQETEIVEIVEAEVSDSVAVYEIFDEPTLTEIEETESEPEQPKFYSELDLIACAQMLYGESRNCDSVGQMRCVWTVCNRVDAGVASTIYEAVTMPYQYIGYSSYNPICDDLVAVAEDVLNRWSAELCGENIERELPRDFLWFSGDGIVNTFRNTYEFKETTKYIK